MPRNKCFRNIEFDPKTTFYKPRGIPMRLLEEITLELDEFESIRLKNYLGLYQDAAAEKMKISRQTFGRILESAHKKIAEALINGKAIRIENEVNYLTKNTVTSENSNPNYKQRRR